MSKLVCLVFALICASLAAKNAFPAKQLAGLPSEFPKHRLPNPADAGLLEQSAFLPMWMDDKTRVYAPNEVIWSTVLQVDSDTQFSLSFLSPMADKVTLALTDANGNNVPLIDGTSSIFPVGMIELPSTTWSFTNPQPGNWQLQVISTISFDMSSFAFAQSSSDIPAGYVIAWNDGQLLLFSHLSSYELEIGQTIGIVSMILDKSISGNYSRQLLGVRRDVVTEAVMEVTLPDGTEEDIQMHDDGLHQDGLANDGIFGGTLIATEPGIYKVEPFLTGSDDQGDPFARTTQHVIAAVQDYFDLAETANGQLVDNDHISINIELANTISNIDTSFRAYAEVYGTANGDSVPVCWLSGIVDISTDANGNNFVTLNLDLKWLALAGAAAPLTLQNVYVQESNYFVPISVSAKTISVTMDSKTLRHASTYAKTVRVSEITKEMREGVPPQGFFNKTNGVSGALVLLHGYCSSTNPWESSNSDWTNPYFFLNSDASITNDEFSQKVLQYVQDNNIDSFSLLGHSQGGMVSAHISNYYFSGLDKSSGGRKIQSIGTPYQGCSAAGCIANLGSVFGVGCGDNFDLSLDGASLWLSGISTSAQNEVYYYTTTYKQGNFFGDYCSLPMNLILEWPNDGTCELDYSTLDGGNSMGNTQEECHITDLAYPAQYHDSARNQVMNANAAR